MKNKKPKRPQQKSPASTEIEQFLETLDQEFQRKRKKVKAIYPINKKTNTISLPKNIEAELRTLVVEGNKVKAVKQVTELTGAGLRVSKDYVDGLVRK